MKTLLTLQILTFICALHPSAAAPWGTSEVRDVECCGHLSTNAVPIRRVRNVTETHSDCNIRAIIVTTVCHTKFCVAPESPWAKKLKREWKPSTDDKMPKPDCTKKPRQEPLNNGPL